jgi:hypothetical protein
MGSENMNLRSKKNGGNFASVNKKELSVCFMWTVLHFQSLHFKIKEIDLIGILPHVYGKGEKKTDSE